MANKIQQRSGAKLHTRALRAALQLALVAVIAITSAQAQTLTVLYSFSGGDGKYPGTAPILDAAGNLYGTTGNGGSSDFGTVFKLQRNRQEMVLHSFTGGTIDGQLPESVLVRDAAGNLYGTTYRAGASSAGTVFKVSPNGTEKILHSFTGTPDGSGPLAGLVLHATGTLYGTTQGGGASGIGTVFRINKGNGVEKVLHSFAGGTTDGSEPYSGLVQDATGNLYGATRIGGKSNMGTLFKLTPKPSGGWTFKLLYSFKGAPDGANPMAAMVLDSSGNLYGTTSTGGSSNGGTLFRFVRTSGKEKVLYSFGQKSGDGISPSGNLVRDAAGTIYGTTGNGGASSAGVVYRFRNGTETILHTFATSDGKGPNGLVSDASGNLYGATAAGGAPNFGTLFKLVP